MIKFVEINNILKFKQMKKSFFTVSVGIFVALTATAQTNQLKVNTTGIAIGNDNTVQSGTVVNLNNIGNTL